MIFFLDFPMVLMSKLAFCPPMHCALIQNGAQRGGFMCRKSLQLVIQIDVLLLFLTIDLSNIHIF